MKRQWMFALTFLMMFLTGHNLMAQNVTIDGQVTDTSGEPLPGVTVWIQGTQTGAITNLNGEYTIDANPGDVLVYSFIGYTNEEVVVGDTSTINIALTSDMVGLEEVVVIGYGSVKRKDVTTAISTVSTDDLDQRPINMVSQALQGKAAGVSVTRPNGEPGAGMVIRVRGTTSFNGSNDPLYVVDGVPMTDIAFLSANDIESIQILKDASSAAIYGSRAANGVVIITTKSGSVDNARITLTAHTGVTRLANEIESLKVNEYRELLSDMGSTINLPNNLSDQTDWYEETYQSARTENYQLSVSNATDKLSYYISGGYTQEEGIINVAFFERYNFKANIDNQIKPWLNIGANISYSDYASNGIISGQGANRAGVVLSVINTPTYAPIWDPENPGQYNNQFYGANITHPVENMSRSEDNRNGNNRLIATGNAEITFTPDLSFKSTMTMDRSYNHATTFLDPLKTSWGRSQHGAASDNRSLGTVMIFDNILNYNRDLNAHNFDVMLGSSGTTSKWSQSSQAVTHYNDGSIQTINAGNKLSQGNGTYAANWAIMSYLGRVAYNFDSKYLISVNMRADGSSKLHPDHRWGYFPSASAAWRLSSEPFLQDLFWLDDLKIRGGWGQTGNQSGLGDYSYLERYGISRQNWWEPGKENATVTLYQNNLRNTDLTWETTTQSNLGIDLTILSNRINLSADWYYKSTTDMLMNVSLPSGSAQASSITRNEGEMTNTGFEFMVNSRNLTGPFSWQTDFNISFNRNELNSLSLTQIYYDARTSDNLNEFVVRNEPGRSLGGFYGYISDGVDPESGELMYRDFNEDGVLSSSDRTYIGDPNPDFTFGLTNNFEYKGLSLNILLQGAYGNDIFNASRIETEGMYDAKNQSRKVLNRWRIPGQLTDMPKAGYDMKVSSYFVEDGSFLRVKDISLAYNFSGGRLERWGINRLQPYFTATNLLTFTNYSGMDPEVNQWGNSGAVQGIDWGTIPTPNPLYWVSKLNFKQHKK
ncbi:SusC, outer membrane protein [Geofilum rubicundum JCM 15548]|uniref:SusC, outer membrane protein n=2 Tax=Geofilum TaxID=1236988 RepID=A0A0E9LWL3_9BACT|nr:SusC, outer membrane protein [Geofilum rubicundum JCM 15548]